MNATLFWVIVVYYEILLTSSGEEKLSIWQLYAYCGHAAFGLFFLVRRYTVIDEQNVITERFEGFDGER